MTPADTPDIVEDTEQLSPEETVIMPLSEYLTMRSDLTKALQRVIEQAHELLALRAEEQRLLRQVDELRTRFKQTTRTLPTVEILP